MGRFAENGENNLRGRHLPIDNCDHWPHVDRVTAIMPDQAGNKLMDDLSPRTYAALVKLAGRFGLDVDAVINRYLNNRAYAAAVGDRYSVAELEAAIRAYGRHGVAAL